MARSFHKLQLASKLLKKSFVEAILRMKALNKYNTQIKLKQRKENHYERTYHQQLRKLP